MLTLWPSNPEDLWETTPNCGWVCFPQAFFCWIKVASRDSLSTSLSFHGCSHCQSDHLTIGSILISLLFDFGGFPSSIFLVCKSMHSTENNNKTFPANSCSWISSLSLLCLYLSCIPVPFWVRVAILWSFVLLFESHSVCQPQSPCLWNFDCKKVWRY